MVCREATLCHTHGKTETVKVKPLRRVEKPERVSTESRASLKKKGGKPGEQNWSAAADALGCAPPVASGVY